MQGNTNKNEKRELNQEDIEAVEFLASEFSKETQNPKSVEQKDMTEIETVDSTMLEVASVQGVNEQTELSTQCTVINEASTSCQVFCIFLYSLFFIWIKVISSSKLRFSSFLFSLVSLLRNIPYLLLDIRGLLAAQNAWEYSRFRAQFIGWLVMGFL